MRRHVVACARVDKPYIFCFGCVGRVGGSHRVRSLPHHKNFATSDVVRVGCIVCELSNCASWRTLLFVTLCLGVAKLATVPTLGKVVLTARFSMGALPSSWCSASCLSVVEVFFPGLPLIVPALALSSSFIRVCIKHLTIICLASHSDMVFFHQ